MTEKKLSNLYVEQVNFCREMLKQEKVSPRFLHENLGCSRSTLSQIKIGHRFFSAARICLLYRFIKIYLDAKENGTLESPGVIRSMEEMRQENILLRDPTEYYKNSHDF